MKKIMCVALTAAILFFSGCGSELKPPYTNGQFKVGADIPAGEYVAIGHGSLEVRSSADHNTDNLIAHDPGIWTRKYIDVRDGEYISVGGSDLKLYPAKDAPEVEMSEQLSDGQYKVGRDIPAGEYKIALQTGGIYEVTTTTRLKWADVSAEGIVAFVSASGDGTSNVSLVDGQYLNLYKVAKIEAVKIAPLKAESESAERYEPPKPAPVVEAPAPRLTVEEFDARFLDVINTAADAVGSARMDGLGTPERRVENGREWFIYSLDRDLSMSESTSGGAIKAVNLNLTNITRDNLLMTLIAFDAAVRSFSDDADINAIHRALGLDGNIIADLTKSQSVTLNGIKYSKKFVSKNYVVFSVSE